MKTEISVIPEAMDLLNKLRGVHYKWKASGAPAYGVIAQEVQPIMPEAVSVKPNTDELAVSYNQLIPVVMEATKELNKTVLQLQESLKQSQKEIQSLRDEMKRKAQ